MSNISLTTLGGVRENGKNMYIAEIDGSIFVLDAGLKYPENEQLGVDTCQEGPSTAVKPFKSTLLHHLA